MSRPLSPSREVSSRTAASRPRSSAAVPANGRLRLWYCGWVPVGLIVTVGGALVFFAFVIPPRLGLTLEMGVALMLIVLGMWNLTGFFEQVQAIRRSGRTGRSPIRAHCHGHGNVAHRHGGWDADRDGVPNRYDRSPSNPYRAKLARTSSALTASSS